MHIRRCLCAVAMLVSLTVTNGCQTWHSGSAISGLTAKASEREAIRQAKNDPFPSPSDVGMTVEK